MDNIGLYVIITKPTLSYRQVAEICVEKQIKMLQLREKFLSDNHLLKVARDLRDITKGTNTQLVINDRPDIAKLCNADVLHLGQDDVDIEDARKIVGDMKIGLSTHSIMQAKIALEKNPYYIGFGPVYPTTTKQIADPTVGTDMLKKVVGFSNVPVIAIGGIFPENIPEIKLSGASSYSLVRYLMENEKLEQRIDECRILFE